MTLIRAQRVFDLLSRVTYAGYIEVPGWNVSLRPGKHKGLISFETFQRMQERLNGDAKAPARADIAEDFPLRGFILCGDCDKPMTACWSTGKAKKYPYYLCQTRTCPSYRKSIRRDDIEGEFEELLRELQPTDGLFRLAGAMFRDAWDQRRAQSIHAVKSLQQGIVRIDKQIETFLDRIVDATTASVVAAYEKRIADLERVSVADLLEPVTGERTVTADD